MGIKRKQFKVDTDWYGEEEWKAPLYPYNKFNVYPGITILVGCNGSGKTTLLQQMMEQLDDQEIDYIDYSDINNGRTNARDRAVFSSDIPFLGMAMSSSEGEEVFLNFARFCSEIGRCMRQIIENSKAKNAFVFLDAIDSGLSLDNFSDIKTALNSVIKNVEEAGKSIYFIITANSYEFTVGEKCFDVTSGKYIEFASYEEYRDYIIKTRQLVDHRYGFDSEEEKDEKKTV